MPLTAVLEFVEVAQGEFVLRQPGSEGEPLVRIRFSEESAAWLAEGRLHVAKAMVVESPPAPVLHRGAPWVC